MHPSFPQSIRYPGEAPAILHIQEGPPNKVATAIDLVDTILLISLLATFAVTLEKQ